MEFSTILLSGGGVKGAAQLGALSFFYGNELVKYETVKIFAGTSAGSIIATLLSIGYTPSQIMERVRKLEIHVLSDFSLKRFLQKWGFCSMRRVKQYISELFKKSGKFDSFYYENERVSKITLHDMYRITGKTLIFTVVNLTDCQLEHLSWENAPDLDVFRAISMSCNLPLIFPRKIYNEKFYVDGGVLDDFPIEAVDDGQSRLLAIRTLTKIFDKEISTPLKYLVRIIDLMISWHKNITKFKKSHIHVITINCNDSFVVDSAKEHVTSLLYAEGFRTASEIFLTNERKLE